MQLQFNGPHPDHNSIQDQLHFLKICIFLIDQSNLCPLIKTVFIFDHLPFNICIMFCVHVVSPKCPQSLSNMIILESHEHKTSTLMRTVKSKNISAIHFMNILYYLKLRKAQVDNFFKSLKISCLKFNCDLNQIHLGKHHRGRGGKYQTIRKTGFLPNAYLQSQQTH